VRRGITFVLIGSLATPAHALTLDTEVVIAVLFWYTLALCVVTVPISLLLPNRSKSRRVAFGVCVPLAAVIIGTGVTFFPLGDDIERLFFFGLPSLTVLGFILFVIREKYRSLPDPTEPK